MAKYTLDDEARRFTTLVNAIPRLTREQELELARRYHELGDLRARDRVLESNLRHVLPYALRQLLKRHSAVTIFSLNLQS